LFIKKAQNYVNKHNLTDLITFLYEKSGLKNSLLDGTTEGETRDENVQELLSVATKYDDIENALDMFIEEVALASDTDKIDKGTDMVHFMTLHSAKGLEFPVVFILGMEEGVFPSQRTMDENGAVGLEEELDPLRHLAEEEQPRPADIEGTAEARPPRRVVRELRAGCEGVERHAVRPREERVGKGELRTRGVGRPRLLLGPGGVGMRLHHRAAALLAPTGSGSARHPPFPMARRPTPVARPNHLERADRHTGGGGGRLYPSGAYQRLQGAGGNDASAAGSTHRLPGPLRPLRGGPPIHSGGFRHSGNTRFAAPLRRQTVRARPLLYRHRLPGQHRRRRRPSAAHAADEHRQRSN